MKQYKTLDSTNTEQARSPHSPTTWPLIGTYYDLKLQNTSNGAVVSRSANESGNEINSEECDSGRKTDTNDNYTKVYSEFGAIKNFVKLNYSSKTERSKVKTFFNTVTFLQKIKNLAVSE